MEPTFNSNHIITVTELTGVMGSEGEETIDIGTRHIVSYRDGVIRTLDGRAIIVKESRLDIRRKMDAALLT